MREEVLGLLKPLLLDGLLDPAFSYLICIRNLPPLIEGWYIRGRKRSLTLAKRPITARHLLIDGLNKVFHQMKPIRDLKRLWGSFTCSLCIILASISADISDLGMLSHPLCRALGGSLCQQVDHLVRTQIHQDRAKLAPSLEREIIDAKPRRPREVWLEVIP